MHVDVLVAEIGSTTTVVNAFSGIGTKNPVFLGQGQAPTTVEGAAGVTLGLQNAIDSLCKTLGTDTVTYDDMLATSSAAGGLRMTVHGLVYDMTVRAAKEAALGAGANLHLVTAGVLTEYDLNDIDSIRPNLILLAGGTDYGERDTAVQNAKLLTKIHARPPVIYAGNIQNQRIIEDILSLAGFKCYITENVYPKLDDLNIEPTRRIIHHVFEEHITKAQGMSDVRKIVTGTIMPTPGAVMECAHLLYNMIGDLVVIDVGGATTDVHSVTEGSEEVTLMQISPEPKAKRTVEGDLGVYVNAQNLIKIVGLETLEKETGLDVTEVLADYQPIPQNKDQRILAKSLSWHAASTALVRHAGKFRYIFGASGRRTYAEGKDLTNVKTLIATGGALTRMPGRDEVLARLRNLNEGNLMLFPRPGAFEILQDHDYIMASLGALSIRYPQDASILMKKSLGIFSDD